MDANQARSKCRLKTGRDLSPGGSGSHLNCSRSFNNPDNHQGIKYEGSKTQAKPYDKPLNPKARQESFHHRESRVATPFYQTCATRLGTPALRELGRVSTPVYRTCAGTPALREMDTTMSSQRTDKTKKPDLVLPEIGLNVWPDRCRGSEEILHEWGQEGLIPEPQCIRHTRSGIAYSFVFGPPTHKPLRLPRIVSEGVLEKREKRHRREEKLLIESVINEDRSPSRRKKTDRSGGRLNDTMRSTAENSRQQREKKNFEKTRSKLHLQDERASRLGRPCDDTAARVQEVLAKQEEIREHERLRVMENFMKQKKKKH